MGVIAFHEEQKFVCPCGCKQKFVLTIQHSESAGWNAFVSSEKKELVAVGENNYGD